MKEIAQRFMSSGVCDWPNQKHKEKQKATADYLRAAGFDVEPSGIPVFGGMFRQQPITGPDGEAAWEWLDGVLKGMKRGKFEREVEHLTAALVERQKIRP